VLLVVIFVECYRDCNSSGNCVQDKKEKHHHHHHRHHKKSTSDDVAGPSSDLLVATGSTESPNAEQYSMLLQTSASASDISSAANGPAVNIDLRA